VRWQHTWRAIPRQHVTISLCVQVQAPNPEKKKKKRVEAEEFVNTTPPGEKKGAVSLTAARWKIIAILSAMR
jgi:hypothetical protein